MRYTARGVFQVNQSVYIFYIKNSLFKYLTIRLLKMIKNLPRVFINIMNNIKITRPLLVICYRNKFFLNKFWHYDPPLTIPYPKTFFSELIMKPRFHCAQFQHTFVLFFRHRTAPWENNTLISNELVTRRSVSSLIPLTRFCSLECRRRRLEKSSTRMPRQLTTAEIRDFHARNAANHLADYTQLFSIWPKVIKSVFQKLEKYKLKL